MDEGSEQLQTTARARVERQALNAGLLDAAFAVISYSDFDRRFGPLPHPLPIDLDVLRNRFSESEISDACRRVIALLQDAYQAGDDVLSNRLTYPESIHRLRQGHPGFSEECYDRTVNQGLFMAR
ncbi:hypothetical protein [Labrys monachus]|uniref:Uncharacterized protein n=1 Tax=Labrys monachus TaxID=217067 RepID=A0ABU0F748_9HYPH|nr:hypothetical protein [Labrys monachus]MDQ0390442.1 hypothetical protein [Labrys monachus]